jgi:hypothetical protein
MADNTPSGSFSFNFNDLVSVSKNALLVAVAAGLTYVGENIANVDLGPSGLMIVPIVTVAINTLVRWVKDNTKG